ncbi:hypothetical protein Q428_05490 [Fervidicella metallireducens AeB]|uniref:Uncharacterized protein n=1 Tax=Fervidicella metallireducens AeB TaxID=1403537 RepID=A0A017RVW9_9CLOT|nr:DUF6143 family protein [Fervidicella metallireducens]EYE88837.1 hypothetical protein Q428_05490 [Fervidicella metallireducens AeB]
MSNGNYMGIYRTVNIPNSLYQSVEGRYFVGQTGFLNFGCCKNAWGALVNPSNSNVNIFVNVFTISNYSRLPFNAEIWLNSTLPDSGNSSNSVSPTNTTLNPAPCPRGKIVSAQIINGTPVNGVNVFNRIIPPETTIVSEEDGKFIIPPGGNFAIFLPSPAPENIIANIAFGWWEERIRQCSCCC